MLGWHVGVLLLLEVSNGVVRIKLRYPAVDNPCT